MGQAENFRALCVRADREQHREPGFDSNRVFADLTFAYLDEQAAIQLLPASTLGVVAARRALPANLFSSTSPSWATNHGHELPTAHVLPAPFRTPAPAHRSDASAHCFLQSSAQLSLG